MTKLRRAALAAIAGLAGGMGLMVVSAEPADAYHETRFRDCRVIDGVRYCPGSRRYYMRETYEDIRANSLDPAGDYKYYPSWARSALSPKGDGGGFRR